MLSSLKLLALAAITYSLTSLPIALMPMTRPAIAQNISPRRTEADRLLREGFQQFQTQQIEAALMAWQKSLAIYREIKERGGEGEGLGSLGIAYHVLRDYDKAIKYQLQSLAIAREIKDRIGEMQSLSSLGNSYYAAGNYDQAIASLLQSLAIARENKERASEMQVLSNLGFTYYSLGKYDQAIEYYLQHLAIARESKERIEEEQSLGYLGNAYRYLSKYDKAIDYGLQRLAVTREIKDREGEGQALGNLGLAYYYLGRYDKAIDYQLQRLTITREIKDRLGEGQALGNLGITYLALGNYDKVVEYQLQRLVIARKIADRLGESQALGNLGIAYDALGKYEKAIQYHLQGLAINRELKNRQGESGLLINLGLAYHALEKYSKAAEYYLQSLVIKRELKDKQGEGVALSNLGRAYLALGNRDQAIEYYLQGLAIARETKDRQGEAIDLNNLGAVSYQQNQPELAILFYKQSVNVRESIRNDIKNLDKATQQSYAISISGTYRRLADVLLRQNRVMEALQVLDLLKVQELEDYLKNIKGNDRTLQGVRLLDAEKVVSEKLTVSGLAKSSEINRQLAIQIQQIPKSDINQVPEYLQKIPQGNVLIYPLILSDRLEIILFAPNILPISRTVPITQSDLDALIVEFRTALQDSGSDDVKEPAQKLYNLLIKPIEADLIKAKATTILYAPDQQLRYAPLAALYDGKQWLSEKYRISNLIAYSLSDFSAKTKRSPNVLAGAFGGKAGENKFGQVALPATLIEVRAISKMLQNSTTLEERDFSLQAIKDHLSNHNILHFATHAEFNIGKPENSRIFFGNGDILQLNEITALPLQYIDLMILSACQTGVGKLGDGVEILGFGYQVQKAGAKTAIASLWKVDDAGTQALMDAFYQELQSDNLAIAESLQKAQIKMIRSSQYNHPAFWSAFFIIGNGL